MFNEKLEKAKTKIALNDKLLSYLLSHFRVDLNYQGKTAATNGNIIFFNQEFLETLSVFEVEFVLLHELLHITLDHLPRRKNRNHDKFNIAADIVINDILLESGYKPGKLNLVRGLDFNIRGSRHSVEEVYEMLEDKVKINYYLVSNHFMWDDENRVDVRKIINEGIEKNYSSSNKLLNRLVKSVISKGLDWKKVLEDILSKEDKDYYFNKPDSRFRDFILPYFLVDSEHLNNVWLFIDVSASMKDSEVAKVFNEVNGIIKAFDSVELKVSFFSTLVTTPVLVTNVNNLKAAFNNIKSTGGTSFDVIFDYLDSNIFDKPKAVMIFTDGHAKFPSEVRVKGLELFWVINNDYINVPYGYRVNI